QSCRGPTSRACLSTFRSLQTKGYRDLNFRLTKSPVAAHRSTTKSRREEEMSRSRRTTSLGGSIARCAKFVSMGALVSLLILPVAHAQKGGNGPSANNGGNGGDS